MKVHSSITLARIARAVAVSKKTLTDPGFCIKCGLECYGVEPDARKYPCESCGEFGVYGAEELLFHLG